MVDFEQMRLLEARRPAGVRGGAGRPGADGEFTSTVLTDSSVTFENLEHDFPQRVIYRRTVLTRCWRESKAGGMVLLAAVSRPPDVVSQTPMIGEWPCPEPCR